MPKQNDCPIGHPSSVFSKTYLSTPQVLCSKILSETNRALNFTSRQNKQVELGLDHCIQLLHAEDELLFLGSSFAHLFHMVCCTSRPQIKRPKKNSSPPLLKTCPLETLFGHLFFVSCLSAAYPLGGATPSNCGSRLSEKICCIESYFKI